MPTTHIVQTTVRMGNIKRTAYQDNPLSILNIKYHTISNILIWTELLKAPVFTLYFISSSYVLINKAKSLA